jgi:VCBS repeat protein
MAITVTGANPTVIRAVSNTITTNTTFPANPPNDASYLLPGSLTGIVNPGVAVGGAGFFLQSTTVLAGARVDFTNNGVVTVDQVSSALGLRTNGGVVTYAGAGSVINSGTGTALSLIDGQGSAEATVAGNIIANEGTGVSIVASTGVTFAQTAGSFIGNTIGTGANAVSLAADTGDIEAILDGTIVANLNAFAADSDTGDITVDFTGELTTNAAFGINTAAPGTTLINSSGTIGGARGIQAVGQGAGLVTVNMTGGQIDTAIVGMELVSSGTGGVVVDMSGGQIGSAAQRAGGIGIVAQANGAAGALDLTVSSVWTDSTALLPSIGHAANDDDINLTINGTVDSLAGNGISADHFGTGDINITNNGTITAFGVAIAALTSPSTRVFNAGTLTGSTVAIFFAGGNDMLTLAPTSVINGTVLAETGFDTLQLGGTTGTGTFDVSDIGNNTEQYRNFEIFNVIGAAWTLTGTGAQDWTMSGGTLGGTATIGNLTVTGGTVAPGASAGILSTGHFGLAAAATFAVEIGGTNPGTGHDQISVNGLVTLGGTLAPTLINGFNPVPGTEFVIIANNAIGAVVGTFAGLAEGALFTAGGSSWRISYTGGDGNDVALTAIEPLNNDFGGDFHSDILWRDDAGVVALWEMDGVTVLTNQAVGTLPAGAEIEAADGDFNADGTSDILVREADGTVRLWQMDGANIVADTAIATVREFWHIADTGDFNGDGRHDILWRDDAGSLVLWEMDGPNVIGSTAINSVVVLPTIEAVADFTGDGRADILGRGADGTVRLWEMDGATIVSDTEIANLPDYWHLADTGDFNGDFRADILWRDDAGTVVMWEMDGPNIIGNTALGTLPDYWLIADTGDYTGDLRDDILWRDDAGTIVLWEMNGPTVVDNSVVNTIPTSWHIVA